MKFNYCYSSLSLEELTSTVKLYIISMDISTYAPLGFHIVPMKDTQRQQKVINPFVHVQFQLKTRHQSLDRII